MELSNIASECDTDIIIGTETWLDESIKNSELLLDDYDIFRRDRPTRGGGVLLAIKKSLLSEHISTSETTETISCKIKLKGSKPLIISSVYRPPDYTLEDCLEIVKEINVIHKKNKGASYFISGDFNLPDIDWTDHTISGNKYAKPINELFLDTSHDLGLTQVVDKPTRGPSVLDLCFTNFPHLISKCDLISGLGDHEIVSVTASINPLRKKTY